VSLFTETVNVNALVVLPSGTGGARNVGLDVFALPTTTTGVPPVCVQANVIAANPGNFGTLGSVLRLASSVTVCPSIAVCEAVITTGGSPGLTVIPTMEVPAKTPLSTVSRNS
jgi:hypothetical protein